MKYQVLSETKKSYKKILPSLGELEQVRGKIKQVPNRRGEFKRKIHYGCYLLCSQSGLRISEAVKFDLSAKNKKGLYRINKCKGNKTRYVYVPKQVISELKKNNWQPNQTNRFAFYHFLRKIKREVNISKNVELSPHTFRRAFTTYHANSGMPLPLLQKLLGHSSIRTTALYWQNTYGEDDPNDILAGKNWLERHKPSQNKNPPQPPAEITTPSRENFPKTVENLKPDIISNKPIISAEEPNNQNNSLLPTKTEKKPAINYQPKPTTKNFFPLITKKEDEPPKIREKFLEQLPAISKKEPTAQEKFLLIRIKQLEEQLTEVKAENEKLRTENQHLKALIKQDHKTETKILQPLPFKPNK